MMIKNFMIAAGAAASALLFTQSALAGAHTWRINEVFSNASGTIQFIELREAFGGAGETFLSGLTVRSQATGNVFTFPSNLVGPTSNRSILLATASFAALPGVPTPDHIIPQNFFNPSADTIRYHNGIYDTWVLAAGVVPTDLCNSFQRNWGGTPAPGLNSPKNYANVEGHYAEACEPPPPVCAADMAPAGGDGLVNVDDLLILLAAWGTGATNADLVPDGTVNVDDLLALLQAWGPCKK